MSYADDLLMETNRDHQLLAFKQDAAGEGQITTDVVVRTEFSCYAIIFRPRRPHVENDTWKNRIYSIWKSPWIDDATIMYITSSPTGGSPSVSVMESLNKATATRLSEPSGLLKL